MDSNENQPGFDTSQPPRYESQPVTNGSQPGYNMAVASLVLGIISVVFWFFGVSALMSVLIGIVGLVCAGKSKKAGYVGGMRTAGFVLSLIGLIVGAFVFVACVACVGALGVIGIAAGAG